VKQRAECTWQSCLAEKYNETNSRPTQKHHGNFVFEIMEGFNAYHGKYNLKNFANNKGKITMDNTEEYV